MPVPHPAPESSLRGIAQARDAWLGGDRAAWKRYTQALSALGACAPRADVGHGATGAVARVGAPRYGADRDALGRRG